MILSYADTAQNHIGAIYQAGNWIYLGLKGQNMYDVYRKKDNKKLHMRNVRGLIARKRAVKNDFIWNKALEKHKYAIAFDKRLKSKLLNISKKYPKRATSIDNDAASNHDVEGGVIPTVALHSTPGNKAELLNG